MVWLVDSRWVHMNHLGLVRRIEVVVVVVGNRPRVVQMVSILQYVRLFESKRYVKRSDCCGGCS